MTKANRLALSVLIVLSLAAFAAAQSYTVTDLGPGQAFAINSLGQVLVQQYPSGNSFVWISGSMLYLLPLTGDYSESPSGINRQGLAVGASDSTISLTSAVLWTKGVPLDLGTLGGKSSAATAINASGEVVGFSNTPTGTEAFLWSKATGMQGLGFLSNGGVSNAFAINRFGKVAGVSGANGDNTFYAFTWSKASGMRNLGTLPGYPFSGANAINDSGQVAGSSDCTGQCGHAVVWGKTKGSILDLGLLPGALASRALGINNVGQVVGSDFFGGNDDSAFVWSPSTGMLDLNNLIPANSGWLLQIAEDINDKGQIVGYGLLNGQPEAFLLTPQ